MTEIKPKLAELFSFMDAARASLMECAENMNPSFAVIRPRDGEWSAAENLAHLAIVEYGIDGLMEKAIGEAKAQGIGADTSETPFMNSLDRYRVADPQEKLTAPTRIHPDGSKSVQESLDSLKNSRQHLKSILEENAEIDLGSIKRPHPYFGDLDMYQWALFVAQHEMRHTKQMLRVLDEVTERAAECAPIV
jgi:hypothetical protein